MKKIILLMVFLLLPITALAEDDIVDGKQPLNMWGGYNHQQKYFYALSHVTLQPIVKKAKPPYVIDTMSDEKNYVLYAGEVKSCIETMKLWDSNVMDTLKIDFKNTTIFEATQFCMVIVGWKFP